MTLVYLVFFFFSLLSVILLNVILLNVILLNVILLNVILMNVFLLNVILLNVILLNFILLSDILTSDILLIRMLQSVMSTVLNFPFNKYSLQKNSAMTLCIAMKYMVLSVNGTE